MSTLTIPNLTDGTAITPTTSDLYETWDTVALNSQKRNVQQGSNFISIGYTILLAGGYESGTLTDAVVYFIGGDLYNSGLVGLSGAGAFTNAAVRVPRTGQIQVVNLNVRITTPGTNETVTHAIRINDTTDVYPLNLTYNAVTAATFGKNLSVAVSAGDLICLKITSPTWATNPIGVRWYCNVTIV